jgi:hypothetical protein
MPIMFNRTGMLSSSQDFDPPSISEGRYAWGPGACQYIPATFGLYMVYSDFQTILPLDISLVGGRASLYFGRNAAGGSNASSVGEEDGPGDSARRVNGGFSFDNDKLGFPIEGAFEGFSVLHVRDAALGRRVLL